MEVALRSRIRKTFPIIFEIIFYGLKFRSVGRNVWTSKGRLNVAAQWGTLWSPMGKRAPIWTNVAATVSTWTSSPTSTTSNASQTAAASKLVWTPKDLSPAIARNWAKNNIYRTSYHNLFFRVRKMASLGVIGKLWGDAASYGNLLWFQKIEAISVDSLDFLESENPFLSFFVHKMERKGNRKAKTTSFFFAKKLFNCDNLFPTFLFSENFLKS